jgi:hypothetical protein
MRAQRVRRVASERGSSTTPRCRYERRDQESEQLGSGLAAWRIGRGANSAWLESARLAWNLGTWIVQLALPNEVVRWEWKRVGQTFVYAAAQVICSCRQESATQKSCAHPVWVQIFWSGVDVSNLEGWIWQ